MKAPDLTVKLGHLKLKNPVIAASGTFGYGTELKNIVDINRLGGVITKTITLNPRLGNPPPRIYETSGGILNSIGLENPGLDEFTSYYLPSFTRLKTIRIVSIGGDAEELPVIAKKLSAKNGIDALEINISCPNIAKCGPMIAKSPVLVSAAVKKIRKATRLPLIVKLSPNVTDIAEIADAACSGGADIISLINTITGMAVDWRSGKPLLGNITGGLSGPCVKPIALRMVWEVAKKVKAPIIGLGGVMEASDVMEFMAVGASAVAVGTANIISPDNAMKIIEELPKLLKEENIPSISRLIGTFKA
ncbi:MAG: dihydroorotate dehydrogenase [Planctomycetes bacterium]|nr:dihydroorotate dehydrogenase [Planctomycetota bacterium]